MSKVMLGLLVCLLVLVPLQAARAQDVAFTGPSAGDDAALDAAVTDLAKRLIADYREPDRAAYLGQLFRLQLAAGRFDEAIATIKALRSLRDPEVGQPPMFLQYEMYARAKAMQSRSRIGFAEAYAEVFGSMFGSMDDRTAHRTEFSLGTSVSRLHGELQGVRERLAGQSRLPIADALELVRKHQVHEAYAEFSPLVDALIEQDDARRYVIDRNAVVTTPAGVSLAATIVRSKTAPPLPTLFQFTIYANDAWSYLDAKRSAAYGYAGVVAYTRGKKLPATAPMAPFEHDGEDAAAVIDWIARQPWSDGRVAMYGGSYSGFTQWAAARHRPAALKAMATSATTAPGIDVPMEGNVFMNFMYPWPFYTTNLPALDDATYDDEARWRGLDRNWYTRGSSYRSMAALDGTPNPVFQRWLQHPDYDAYWQRMIPQGAQYADIDIPVLATTGYFDGAQVGVLHYFTQHLLHRPDADHTLLIGPYEHLSMNFGVARVVEGYELDPVAQIDLQDLRLQWFDHVLKGAPRPSMLKDRINHQVMGANVWMHAPSLAAMTPTSTRLYLQAGSDGAAERLAAQPGRAPIVQRVDLADRSDAAWLPSPDSLTDTLDAHGGLVFTSDAVTQDTQLSGQLSGRLELEANKRDLDVSLTLYERTPQGRYLRLASWMRRASYGRDRSRRQLLVPGERQSLDFTFERLVSRLLRPGSQVVLVMGVNRQPGLQLNLGSGKDVSDETLADAGKPLQVRWHAGSYIDLPMGPWREP